MLTCLVLMIGFGGLSALCAALAPSEGPFVLMAWGGAFAFAVLAFFAGGAAIARAEE